MGILKFFRDQEEIAEINKATWGEISRVKKTIKEAEERGFFNIKRIAESRLEELLNDKEK
jgi:hypothetical protein